MDTRKCKTCGETKPLNEYNFKKSFHYKKVNKVKTNIKLPNFRKECLDCYEVGNRKRAREWRDKNTERHREQGRKYYLRNKERIASEEKRHRLERKKKAIEYKGGRCVDCVKQGRDGIFPPCAMDFHHSDPSNKKRTPSALLEQRHGWEEIKIELDKCVLICSNCHRIRHHGDGELLGTITNKRIDTLHFRVHKNFKRERIAA